ncbi:hypothetical protein DF182_02095 [Chitinophaga flava]|uniref:Uncharacterized protein n=2 Tax=Chitinophaga flava TaxID=2259036 RepID=A0A365XYL8_9BACT|nr:hypothetical protein DF182_02095 [Chitinophaga flava]
MGCGNPSASNGLKQETANRDTLLSDTFKKKEVIANNISSEVDTAYSNTILSYKDSIDNQRKTLRKVNKSLEGSSEGGEAILYLSGKDTLQMNITFYGETGKSVYVLYLRNGHPVFYIGTTTFYSEPINISKDVKTDSTTVDKIILRNNAIVSWLQNGGKVKDKYEEKDQEIRDLYSEIQTLIK